MYNVVWQKKFFCFQEGNLMVFAKSFVQFQSCIKDLIETPVVRTMNNFTQHSLVTTLEHCLFVSYVSFLICKFLGLNYYAAARGGLLHDLFLYDWHDGHRDRRFHGFTHPKTALMNATMHFNLSHMEQDIIKKHMWPLTLVFPRYRESYVVSLADKICCILEVLGLYRLVWIRRIMLLHSKFSEVPAPLKSI